MGVCGTSRTGVIPGHWMQRVNMPLISETKKKIKYLPTEAMSVVKARVGRCWLLVTVLREVAESVCGGARTGSRKT